jgi:hypothetical protein
MEPFAILLVGLLLAIGGLVAGVAMMRRAYLAPIDSPWGHLFDALIGPLPAKTDDGGISTQSGPRPRFRF